MRTSRGLRRASASLVGSVVTALVVTGCVATEPVAQRPERTHAIDREVAVPQERAKDGVPPPTLARTPGELARRLVAAEEAIRTPATPPAQLRRAGFETQVLYRQLARRGRWHRPALAAVPPRYRGTVRDHLVARQSFRSMHTTLSRTLPSWRIVRPAPAPELRSYYLKGERRFGVPWEILAAVNLVETGMGRIRGTSVAGARGPMQFMPATWAAFGQGDVDDPHDAIMAAARYLAHNGGGRGQLDRALYAYNRHRAYVRGVKAYASVIRRHPRAFLGVYHWEVLYLSALGDLWLPVGYRQREPLPARRYLARHPERRLDADTR